MIEHYYEKIFVLMEIVKTTAYRDVSFLPATRGLTIFKVDQLKNILNFVRWDKTHFNMYRSVARHNKLPLFTFNPKLRSSETSVWFREEYDKSVYAYDLFMDFDKPKKESWDEVIKEVQNFTKKLNEFKVPYYIIFSGGKGFQIVIDYDYFPKWVKKLVFDWKKEINCYKFMKEFQEKIKEKFKLKYLDLQNNGVPSRLMKVPYSLIYETKKVALPLSQEQLYTFKPEDVNIEKVLKIRLMNRGLLTRFENLSLNEKQQNLNTFIMFVGEKQ